MTGTAPQLQQRGDRGAGVEVAAALLGVAERQQDLAGDRCRAAAGFRTRRGPARSGRRPPRPGSPRASARRGARSSTERPSAMAPEETTRTSAPLGRERRDIGAQRIQPVASSAPLSRSTSRAEPILIDDAAVWFARAAAVVVGSGCGAHVRLFDPDAAPSRRAATASIDDRASARSASVMPVADDGREQQRRLAAGLASAPAASSSARRHRARRSCDSATISGLSRSPSP